MVYFYIPNLIGYTRVILAIVGFVRCFHDPVGFFICYALSQLLDAVDGHAARFFNQTSEYGAVLDMVTDRCSTSALLCVLSVFYPEYILLWMFLVCLDLTSHYAHLASTAKVYGGSHKTIRPDQNFLIRLYYGNKYVLFVLCGCNEAMFLGAYLLHFTAGPAVAWAGGIGMYKLFFLASLPLGIFKQVMNLVQLCQAFVDLAEYDLKKKAVSAGKKN